MAEILPNILGRWRLTRMEGCDPNDNESEVQAFIHFDPHGSGEFAFGLVQGFIDHRLVERDGKPSVEWTWHGNDEMDEVSGRGWAVLHKDRYLRGMFFIHKGHESDFVAKKIGANKPGAFSRTEASKATARQGQFLAFIFHYTKLNGQPPAEGEIQRFFRTTPPTVHQMVLTLEKRGLIERTPGVARSIRLLVSRDQLPELE
jgi:repressor LexA